MNMKLVTGGLVVLFSVAGITQTKRVLPLPVPDVVCLSTNKAFRALVNVDLGIVRIVDVGAARLSHKVQGLVGSSKNGVVKLVNTGSDESLPRGIVFRADLNKKGVNAYSVDDHSGGRTAFSCENRGR
jgi:hypothetical protein